MEVQFGPNSYDEPNLLYKLQRKIKVFDTSDPLSNRGYNLVASASKYGAIFVGTPGGNLAVYHLNELVDKECEPSYLPVQLQEKPSHIAVNSDHELLAVTGGCLFVLFKVVDLLNQNVSPSMSVQFDVSPSTFVSDVKWNPCIPDTIAYAFYDGSIVMCQAGQGMVKKLQSSARCICWSPKGKQLVVGNKDGTICQYKPDLSLMKSYPAPDLFQGCPVEVMAIHWISTFQFAVVFKNASDNSKPAVTIVNTPKGGQPSCLNYEDVCYSMGSSRPWYYYLQGLAPWNVMLCSSSNSMEIATLGTTDGANWLQWCQSDEARPELPLTDKKIENYPIGVAIDTAAVHQLPWGENETLPFMPTLHVLSQTGLLTIFNIINLNKDAPQICTPVTVVSNIPFPAQSQPAPPPVAAAPIAAVPPHAAAAQLAAALQLKPELAAAQSQQAPVLTIPPVLGGGSAGAQAFTAPAGLSLLVPPVQMGKSDARVPQEAQASVAAPTQPELAAPQPQPVLTIPPVSGGGSAGAQAFTAPAGLSLQVPPVQMGKSDVRVQEEAQASVAAPTQVQLNPIPQKEQQDINAAAVKKEIDAQFKNILIRELNEFQAEHYDMVVKTRKAQMQFYRELHAIDTNAELQNLDAATLKRDCSLEDLRSEIIALKLDLVRSCAVVADARTHSDAKELEQWAQADPLTANRVVSVKKLADYVQSQLEQAHMALNYKWNQLAEMDMMSKKLGPPMIRPIMDDIYQPLVKQQEILSRQEAVLKMLKNTLNECDGPVYKSTHILRSTPFKKDHLSKLTKTILNMSLEPQKTENKNLLTPQKLDALRDMLSNHKTVKIKPINVEVRHHMTTMRARYEKSVQEQAVEPAPEVKPVLQPVPTRPIQEPTQPALPQIEVKPAPPPSDSIWHTNEPKLEPPLKTTTEQDITFTISTTPTGNRNVLKNLLENKQVTVEVKKEDNNMIQSFMEQKICSPSNLNFSAVIVATPTSFTNKPISALNNMLDQFSSSSETSSSGEFTSNVKEEKQMSNLFKMPTSTPKPQKVPDVLGSNSMITIKRVEPKTEQKSEKTAEKYKENTPAKSENVILTIPKVNKEDKKENEAKPFSVLNTNTPAFGSVSQPVAGPSALTSETGDTQKLEAKPKQATEIPKEEQKFATPPASSSSIFATANATITVAKPKSIFGTTAATTTPTVPVFQSISVSKPDATSIFASANSATAKTQSSSVFGANSSTPSSAFGASKPLFGTSTATPSSVATTTSKSVTKSTESTPTSSTSTPFSVFGSTAKSIFGSSAFTPSVAAAVSVSPAATTTATPISVATTTSTSVTKSTESTPTSSTSTPFSVFGSTAKSTFGSSAFTPSVAAAVTVSAAATTTSTSASKSTPSTPTGVFASSTPATQSAVSTTTATTHSVLTTQSGPATAIFGSATSTTQPSVFGGAPTSTTSVFGTSPPTPSSVFGSTALKSTFGTSTTTQAPVSTTTTPTTAFGSPATTKGATSSAGSTTSQSSVLGSAVTTQASAFESTATTPTSVFGSTAVTPAATTQTTQASIFGSTTITASAFGSTTTSPPAFGSTATTPSSVFSAATTKASAFGSPATTPPAFGTTQASVFGTPASTQASVFGSTAQPSVFGSPTSQPTQAPTQASVFGSAATTQASVFGTPATSQASVFGTPATQTSVFGAATTQASVFGAPTTQASVFGSPQATQASVFGSPTSPGFGAQSQSVFGSASPSVFGSAQTQTSVFGTPTQSTQASVFGTPTQTTQSSVFGTPTSSASVFGNPSQSVFGAPATTAQSGSIFGGGESLFASVNISTTSASSPSGGSIFGGGSTGSPGFGSSNTNIFGAKTTFGQPNPAAEAIFGGGGGGGGGFGQTQQSTNIWGSNNNSSGGFGSGFGQQPAGSFSAPSPPGQAFGSPTQPSGGGFGSGFGSKAVFGQPTGFGSPTSSGFGAPAAFGGFTKSPGGFGSSASFGAPAFGGSAFGGGGSPSGFGTAAPASGFGSPTQSNSTFENLATQNTGLTFGNLAQQSSQPAPPAPSFNTSPSFTGWRG